MDKDKLDEQEFRERVYADPQHVDQDILDAAAENPAFQEILQQALILDSEVTALLNSVPAPEGFRAKLLAIPEQDIAGDGIISSEGKLEQTNVHKPAANSNSFRSYGAAACAVLAIGVIFSVVFNSGPSSAEVAFGDGVLEHLYLEQTEIAAIGSGSEDSLISMSDIISLMEQAGTQLTNSAFLETIAVRYANPCVILPAYESAHLIFEGSQGAVSVIVINNNSVSTEFSVRDERFRGIVVPMDNGNMILVGENDQDLNDYRDLFVENVEFII